MQNKKTERDETEKIIYINRKINHLNTYGGSKEEEGHF